MIVATDAFEAGDAPLVDRNADEPAPLGSTFKLYVLLAVTQAIEAGELDWDTTLTVTAENRSLPSGELQELPDGTEVTVREAATKMIEISDNTATDMLIQTLGRDAIEEAVRDADHHNPELMSPFLSTREMFQIGGGDPAHLETWGTGTESEQRALLDELQHQRIDSHDIAVGGDPLWPQGVEWFATAEDVAEVHLRLQEQDDPTIRAILSENPGVEDDRWDYVGFKGGSSPGVLTGSWYVEETNGDSYVLVMQAATDDAPGISTTSQTVFFDLVGAALDLVPSS